MPQLQLNKHQLLMPQLQPLNKHLPLTPQLQFLCILWLKDQMMKLQRHSAHAS
jgi:hypothetical protein